MRLTRRMSMRAGGLLFLTSLGGCTTLLKSASDNPRDWQYDPTILSETPNTFFGSAAYGRLYENRAHLTDSLRSGLESSYTPLSPQSVRAVSGVGGVQTGEYGTGSTTRFWSATFLGSFERGGIEERVRTQGNPEGERTYRGFALFEGVDGEAAGGLRGVPGDETPFTMTAVAVGRGAMVVGTVAVRGRNSGMVFADNVVETTIDAATGNGPRLHGNDSYADRLRDVVGEPTVVAGLRTNPTMLRSFRRSDAGLVKRVAAGLRAAGVGLTVEGETGTVTLVGLYRDSQSAAATEIVELVDWIATRATDTPAIESLNAAYEEEALVVTVDGKTQSLVDGTALQALTDVS